MVVGLTAFEVALVLLLTWLFFRSDFAQHASRSASLTVGDWLVMAALGTCLALFVFVLVFWQWRLSGRGRLRVLAVCFVSLLWSFCGFCWYDITRAAQELGGGAEGPSVSQRIAERTAAVGVSVGALAVGLAAVVAVLWLERRPLNRQGAGGKLRKEP